ncbi:hypothetical protein ACOSP7_028694 [Xanthoceras sorbifolium]
MCCFGARRNAAIHGGSVRNASLVFSWAVDYLCPPAVGYLKLNSDVAIREGSGDVGVGVAIRDLASIIVAAVSKLLPGSFSAKLGEFLALRECLILAKSLSLSLSVAEVDASNVASVINSSVPSYGDASFVIDDIKALCKEVGDCCCMAIPRSGNRLAHILASTAFSSGVEQSSSHVAKDCFSVVQLLCLFCFKKKKNQEPFVLCGL